MKRVPPGLAMACSFVIAALVLAGAVIAGDPPTIWTWKEPLGDAEDMSNAVPLTKGWIPSVIDYNEVPEVLARQVHETIVEAGLSEGQVAILLQYFGHGTDPNAFPPWQLNGKNYKPLAPALTWHPADALTWDPNNNWDPNSVEYWKTPWMDWGINAGAPDDPNNPSGIWGAEEWMKRFICEYEKIREGDPNDPNNYPGDSNLPIPSRFHFDTESHIGWGDSWTMEHWQALMEDPRYDDPNFGIPGFPEGKSLKDLFDDSGLDDPNMMDDANDYRGLQATYNNRAWTAWYYGLCYQAMDAALEEAAYSQIREAWPGCICSNYITSARMDGEADPNDPWTDPNNPWGGGRWWMQINYFLYWPSCEPGWRQVSWEGSASLQAPQFYAQPYGRIMDPNNPDYSDPNHPFYGVNDYVDRCMILDRHDLEACINSFPDPNDPNQPTHADELSPWVPLTEAPVDDGTRYGVQSKDHSRRFLAMLRAHGVNEFMVYDCCDPNDPNMYCVQHWNAFADVYHQVWGTDLSQVRLFGTYSATYLEEVQYADDDFLTGASAVAWPSTVHAVDVTAKFDTEFDESDPNTVPDELRVHIEAKIASASESATGTVETYNFTDTAWENIPGATFTLPDSGELQIVYFDWPADPNDVDEYINEANDNKVRVRLTISSDTSFTGEIGLLQLVGSDDD